MYVLQTHQLLGSLKVIGIQMLFLQRTAYKAWEAPARAVERLVLTAGRLSLTSRISSSVLTLCTERGRPTSHRIQ
jgi:hypothetical protein